MADGDFLLRVRGARETRLFRFTGDEAAELHRSRVGGALERPGGGKRLQELLSGRQPESVLPSADAAIGTDVHFDMVAPDELREYMSSRVMVRRAGREPG